MNKKIFGWSVAAAMTGMSIAAAAAPGAASAPAGKASPYVMVDHSNATLLDKGAVQAVWAERMPAATTARLVKLYPPSQWGFLSQVEGGFTAGKVCVVTASVMLAPRSGKTVAFAPSKAATAFDAQPGATQEQCQALAKAKLGEAVTAVMSSLVATK